MLARKDFSRRHDGGLRAVFNRAQHGQAGDNGFAAADIALQQAQHAGVGSHVLIDFLQGVFLRAGQFEGQGSQNLLP